MKTFLIPVIVLLSLVACNNKGKEPEKRKDTRVALRSDTTNVVKLTDTLLINESTCRGCAYEVSTRFSISDSMGIVQLLRVETTDNNSPDIAGGNVQKDLVLVLLKTGTTTIKQYKFYGSEPQAKDSANFNRYTIDVRN